MKTFVQNHLGAHESVAVSADLHWMAFGRGMKLVLIGAAGVVLALSRLPKSTVQDLALIFGFGVLALGTGELSSKLCWLLGTEFVVTTERVVLKLGILRKKFHEVAHRNIESVSVEQTLVGGLMHYGTVTVFGTGGRVLWSGYVRQPFRFHQKAQGIIDSAARSVVVDGTVLVAPDPRYLPASSERRTVVDARADRILSAN